jgi:hypothetical protein
MQPAQREFGPGADDGKFEHDASFGWGRGRLYRGGFFC